MSTSDQDLRPSRETERLRLPVPGDADAADNPTAIGNLADAIEALSRTGFIGWRVGDIKATAVQTAPDGWLMCNGQAISRSVFAALFEAIDVVFGAGNGTNTFNVPDLRNTFPMGAANPLALGVRGGAAEVALSVAQMPHHAHAVADPTHAHGVADPGHEHWPASGGPFFGAQGSPAFAFGGTNIPIAHTGPTGRVGSGIGIYGAATGIGIYGEGGGAAHSNMPPYVGVNFIIKA